MRKIIEVTLAALATIMTIVPIALPATSTGPVTASVTVNENVCSLLIDPASIGFGSLNPGAIKDGTGQDVTAYQDASNTALTLKVSGNDWNTLSSFLVGQTHWSTSSSTYGGMTALTSTPDTVDATLGPTGSDVVHFGLQVPAHQAAGD